MLHLDLTGLKCPIPVLRLGRAIRLAAPGSLIVMVADDPMARYDLPHFCREKGVEILDHEDSEGRLRLRVRTPADTVGASEGD